MGHDNCPSCGKILDAASPLEEGAKPSPGDITLCFYCSSILVFGEDFALREMSSHEFENLDMDFQLQLRHLQQQIGRSHR